MWHNSTPIRLGVAYPLTRFGKSRQMLTLTQKNQKSRIQKSKKLIKNKIIKILKIFGALETPPKS